MSSSGIDDADGNVTGSDEECEEEDQMLYDILVYRDWPKTLSGTLNSDLSSSSSTSWLWPVTQGPDSGPGLPEKVSEILNLRDEWVFSLNEDGSLLAVAQLNLLEIFNFKDHFGTAQGRIKLSRDPKPSLRKLAWCPDTPLLVLTSSTGSVDVFDAYGFHVYTVFSAAGQTIGNSGDSSFASVFFTDVRVKSRDFLTELVLVGYSGKITSFLLSPSGFQEFSSSNVVSSNITAAVFSRKHSLIVVATDQINREGLKIFRLTDESPFYVSVLDDNDGQNNGGWLSNLFVSAKTNADPILSIEVSPEGDQMATVGAASGEISIWQLPSLRQLRKVPLDLQPNHDDVSPSLLQNPKLKRKKQKFMKNPLRWMPLFIRWWDNRNLVISRYSGGISIIPVDREPDRNILGESSEFFSGIPSISQCLGSGFFVLECETITKTRINHDESNDTDDDGEIEVESESEDEGGFYGRGKRVAASVAYMITESERFAPPRKRPKMIFKSYKLLSLIQTTPEDLFNRKIEMEEYGEALIMAQHYGLDSDQVYERQWRLSDHSISAISDYLFKIKRRSLVLKEVLKTIPVDENAVRELLNYGLKESGLDVLVALKDETGKTIFPHQEDFEDTSYGYLTEEEELAKAEERENRLLDKVKWNDLTLNQKDLLNTRRKILKYIHRLDSYLAIGDFEVDFYRRYRDQPILQSAIEFAREGKVRAVATVLNCYANDLEGYHLTILSNFPESLDPKDYLHLVPKVDPVGRVLLPVGPQINMGAEKKDWLDLEFVRKSTRLETEVSDEEFSFDQEYHFEGSVPSVNQLSKWVDKRARDIESQSSIVDYAISLLIIAAENGISINKRLKFNLLTLETMMYDLQMCDIGLRKLEEMSDLEVVLKLMEKTGGKADFIANIQRILMPHLERFETVEPSAKSTLLRHYLLHLSSSSLSLPLELINNSSPTASAAMVFDSMDESVSVGIDCIYAFEASDQQSEFKIGDPETEDPLTLINELTNVLKKRCRNPHVSNELQDVQCLTKACKILRKYSIVKSLQYFRATRTQQSQMEGLLLQVTRRAEGKRPKLQGREWFEVLQDLLELRSSFPVVPLYYCLEVLCESLLSSEEMNNINLVQEMFEYSPADALFKGKSSMLYTLSVYKIGNIPNETKLRVVSKACDYYLDSSKDVDDPNIGLTKKCLDLLNDPKHPALKRFYSLLNSLEMLTDFGVSCLPVVLRTAASSPTNLNVIICKVLNVDNSAYKNVRKILKLVRFLNDSGTDIAEDMKVQNQNAALSSVADYSISIEDYDSCLGVCEMLMEETTNRSDNVEQRQFAVESCLRLSKNESFHDIHAKEKLASFCVNFCTDEELESILKHRLYLSTQLPDHEEDLLPPMLPPVIPDAAKTVASAAANVAEQAANVAGQAVNVAEQAVGATASVISSAAPIPKAAVGISKTLATAVAAGTNVATETGSKAFSSLFGSWSKFTPLGGGGSDEVREQEATDEEPDNATDIEEFHQHHAVGLKSTKIAVNVFYEGCFDGTEKLGGSKCPLENFSCSHHSILKRSDLQLLQKHFLSLFDQGDPIAWKLISDVVIKLVKEDTPLGIALILGELSNRNGELINVEEEKAEEAKEAEEGWSDAELDFDASEKEVDICDKTINDLMRDEVGKNSVIYICGLIDVFPTVGKDAFNLHPVDVVKAAISLKSDGLCKKAIASRNEEEMLDDSS